MKRAKLYTGADAWRNGFGVEAADLLRIYVWANELPLGEFMKLLVYCGRHARGEHVSVRTVTKAIEEHGRSDYWAPRVPLDEAIKRAKAVQS